MLVTLHPRPPTSGLRVEVLRRNPYTLPMRAGPHTLALLALLILPASIVLDSFAQTRQQELAIIREVRFVGNAVVTDRQLRDLVAAKPSLPLNKSILANDLRSIREHYVQLGYYNARITVNSLAFTSDSAFVDVTLGIVEGIPSVIGTLKLTGNHEWSADEVLSQFDLGPGDILDHSILERDIDNLLDRYEQRGYPFTQCEVAGIVRRPGEERDSLDVLLRIDEGERMTIDEIRVEGNKETDARVIVRETRLNTGELFNPVKVDAIRPRLSRLNIFSSVSDPELYLRKGKGGLLIKVQEGRTSTFDGVVGYIPANAAGESGYVTGLASISMRNLFGTGRKLALRWQREDRFSQELSLRYQEPWIFGFPANIGGGFLQRQQDTSYVRRVFDLRGELMLSEELSVSGLFGSESVIPSSDSTLSRTFRSATTTFGVEVLYDTRDDAYSPTSGARYRTDYQYGRKRISDIPPNLPQVAQRVTVQRFSLDLDVFVSPFRRQVVAVGFHGRELRSGQPEESEMYRFGGARTLRGYRENQFLGSRLAWINSEYRFLLARRTFVYGFVDNGYYLRPADPIRLIPRSDAFKVGYGIGVQLETGLGNLGVSFAFGEGDTFGTGKIHVGLINEF